MKHAGIALVIATMIATFAVLGIGLIADRKRAGLLFLVSVPLVVAGLGVAAFHENLVVFRGT